LTFIICQKRHHVRFFPAQRSDSDRSGNCLAGTVVDTAITNPLFRDFYLLAHSGIQGTSRPTHYHILLDENNMDNDTIQNLTNRLSYTYVRCTRSVSIAPPAYYAHLVAARGRFHFAHDDSTSLISSASGSCAEFSGVYLPLPVPISKTMFFC
jgi:eukaryotic translation initiation factor 2C